METANLKSPIILDGAMGTMLQAAGLPLGARPEVYGMEHPEILLGIHRAYVEAGTELLYANTFCANAHKLAGTGHTVREVITANVAIAKEAAGDRARVALDVGPIGELMEPLGPMTFEEAYDIYAEMVTAGADAGAELIVFETMTDLQEVRAAVLAASEKTMLPVWVTMSFEENGRTFTGTLAEAMACTLDGMQVEAMGINCSLGPAEILPILTRMREWTDKPLLVKPNAGLPDPATGLYAMDAVQFALEMEPFFDLGVCAAGGCCGTTPDFIRALSVLRATREEEQREAGPNSAPLRIRRRGLCSSGMVRELNGVRVIGERINPTGKKRFQQALREHDMDYIVSVAMSEEEAGADILDVNVGLPGIDEPALMQEVVKAVQGAVSLPLQIDSSEPAVIEAGLRVCCGHAIINSVNADDEKMDAIFPLVKKYGASVTALVMDHRGIPRNAGERIQRAEKILQRAAEYGIPKENIFFDCLTMTVSAAQEQAKETLKAVRMIRENYGCHCVLGVSNISFGLPARSTLTSVFLTAAMQAGLDLPIINPNQAEVMDAVTAFRALTGEDAGCEAYLDRFVAVEMEKKAAAAAKKLAQSTGTSADESAAAGKGSSKVPEGRGTGGSLNAGSGAGNSGNAADRDDINGPVLKGLKNETAETTERLLQTMPALDVIEQKLIPALDLVGEKYERQEIFIPQLIKAANAASAGFEIVRDNIRASGASSVSRGKIVLATVEGDIHDIGKNIVRTVLENYGFDVIDLGRDVPVQTVVDAVIREDVRLVGLSALMTTTVESMRRTIEAIRASGHDCKIMVGGAVLTPEYAEEIGADFYSKDARESAEIAKRVFAEA